jgi:hypothetical protein
MKWDVYFYPLRGGKQNAESGAGSHLTEKVGYF